MLEVVFKLRLRDEGLGRERAGGKCLFQAKDTASAKKRR